MKHIIPFLFLALCILVGPVFGQQQEEYRVQIAAYNKRVPISYFDKLETEGIFEASTYGGSIYKYFVDGLSKSEAETLRDKARAAGYDNALVVSEAKIQESISNCCYSSHFEERYIGSLLIRNIFFAFDRSDLRTQSRQDLDNLVDLMNENPSYKVELHAHTDARGTDTYNIALAERRKNSAKRYLINKGIATSRIDAKAFGEKNPIARNDVNGTDSPQGRQFNRRVEIIVKDGKQIVDVVEEISIPNSLKYQ